MDRRIRIEGGIDTQEEGGSGEPVTSWSTLATCWAQIQPLSGRELFAAQQVAAKIDTRFRIRYRDDVRPERMRITDENGRIYDVEAVQEIGRREGLEILDSARGEVPA